MFYSVCAEVWFPNWCCIISQHEAAREITPELQSSSKSFMIPAFHRFLLWLNTFRRSRRTLSAYRLYLLGLPEKSMRREKSFYHKSSFKSRAQTRLRIVKCLCGKFKVPTFETFNSVSSTKRSKVYNVLQWMSDIIIQFKLFLPLPVNIFGKKRGGKEENWKFFFLLCKLMVLINWEKFSVGNSRDFIHSTLGRTKKKEKLHPKKERCFSLENVKCYLLHI